MRALAEHGIPAIDLVCVNLYEFEKIAAKKDAPLEELIENIDIGGPTMIRAAAKNWQDVAVVTSPIDYAAILEELGSSGGSLSEETHWRLAKKAFATTAAYDRAVSMRLCRNSAHGRSGSCHARHSRAALARACAMARIRTSRRRCMQRAAAESPERSNCTARSFPTTIWSIWMRPGS